MRRLLARLTPDGRTVTKLGLTHTPKSSLLQQRQIVDENHTHRVDDWTFMYFARPTLEIHIFVLVPIITTFQGITVLFDE